jgi:hypothetical protein
MARGARAMSCVNVRRRDHSSYGWLLYVNETEREAEIKVTVAFAADLLSSETA